MFLRGVQLEYLSFKLSVQMFNFLYDKISVLQIHHPTYVESIYKFVARPYSDFYSPVVQRVAPVTPGTQFCQQDGRYIYTLAKTAEFPCRRFPENCEKATTSFRHVCQPAWKHSAPT